MQAIHGHKQLLLCAHLQDSLERILRMNRKNKIMAALAIGAVALVVASGVTRCTLSSGSEEAPEPSSTQETQLATALPTSAGTDAGAGAQGGFADLKNTSWESEDGKSALSIIEGALIENGEEVSSIIYYSIESESEDSGVLTATLSVSSSMTGDEEKAVAVVREGQDGTSEITCDKLSCKYLRKAAAVAGPLSLKDATQDLFDEFGKGEGDFVSALSDYAKGAYPGAKSAYWSKEVWIDFGSGTKVTNFTLDDAASTIVCVELDAEGKLGVL